MRTTKPIAAASGETGQLRRPGERHRQEQLRRRVRLGERPHRRVRDDADDGEPQAVPRRPDGHPLADGILVRKVGARERLIDHRDRLASLVVGAGDAPAANEPDTHRVEVAAGNRTIGHDRRNDPRHGDTAFDPHDAGEADAFLRERQTGGGGRGGDAGQRRESIQDGALRGDDRRLIRIITRRQSDAEGERRAGVEAVIDRAQLLEAAHHQAGRCEEHQGERDLPAHHQLTGAMRRAARRLAASAVVQRARERHDPQHRHGAEDRGGQDGERERERRDHTIELNLAKPWQTGRPERHEQAHAAPRERQTDDGPGNREQQALGQEIARDAETAGAERPADGDLAAARFRSHQEEIGDVRARDEQHETDRREQNPERAFHPTDNGVFQRPRGRTHLQVLHEPGHRRVVRIGARQVGDQPRQFGADVGGRHPVTRARHTGMHEVSQIGSRFTCSGIQTSTRGSGNA